ncbi:MAG: hypothetical protein A3K19_33615 [Lentisphaerae bacterium RIFOXYB12_FULL_65_16]|nr:MAG: hypothetical protein A3K19_27775 [Lentisphaerae bacterium RIFOXYB12_FULL_65_16]OGV95256.1 MAG: hypothetical protein A3K19_33615 [Lentisphaerae bacterium RIFOXYB12_FULL_65_16]
MKTNSRLTSGFSVRRRIPALVAVALITMAGWVAGAPANTVVIRLATVAPDRSVWVKALRDAAADVAKVTEGRVQLKIYAGGVQGDEQTVLRKMRVGQLQGAAFMGQGVRLFCADATVLQLPLMFRTEEEFDQTLKDLDADLRVAARENQAEILAWTRQGFAYLYSRKEVADLGGLRQTKPWLVPDDGFSETLYRVAAVTGVSIPISDVLTGLQSGLLDTVYAPPLAMIALQWHSRVSYKLDLGLAYSTGAVVLTSESWNKISAADRPKVQEVFSRRVEEMNALVRKQNEEAETVMAKQVQTVKPTDAAVAEFRQVSETLVKQLTGQAFSEAIAKKFEASLARQREKK